MVGASVDADFRIVRAVLGSRGSIATGGIDAIVIYKADAVNGDVPPIVWRRHDRCPLVSPVSATSIAPAEPMP